MLSRVCCREGGASRTTDPCSVWMCTDPCCHPFRSRGAGAPSAAPPARGGRERAEEPPCERSSLRRMRSMLAPAKLVSKPRSRWACTLWLSASLARSALIMRFFSCSTRRYSRYEGSTPSSASASFRPSVSRGAGAEPPLSQVFRRGAPPPSGFISPPDSPSGPPRQPAISTGSWPQPCRMGSRGQRGQLQRDRGRGDASGRGGALGSSGRYSNTLKA
ncbi:hypothetical protein T484DRAFT_1970505 [Baffinella frigidus]|nr:hypothetical protein T484DRAFT_1970505 [Cryptophyta sp. CCMP2293]